MSASQDESYQANKNDCSELNVNFSLVPKSCAKIFPGSLFNQLFTGYRGLGIVQSEPGGLFIGSHYPDHAHEISNLNLRPDDIWILSQSRCGTTWTQEMVWLLANNCDTESARNVPLFFRSPFLEFCCIFPTIDSQALTSIPHVSIEQLNQMPSPRIIKSHLPFYLLPPKLLETCKVVYVTRNPKDVIVSFYYRHKAMKHHGYKGNLEQFAQYFMENELLLLPFFPHVIDAWNKRHHPNMHFTFFEDRKRDLRGEIEKVAKFLGYSVTNEQLHRLKEHLLFENFAKNQSVNNEVCKTIGVMEKEGAFIRKGKTGDWKNHFSTGLNKQIDEWIEKNLEGTDLKFTTELDFQD